VYIKQCSKLVSTNIIKVPFTNLFYFIIVLIIEIWAFHNRTEFLPYLQLIIIIEYNALIKNKNLTYQV